MTKQLGCAGVGLAIVVTVFVLAFLISLVEGAVVCWLWNVIPPLERVWHAAFWPVVALIWLLNILLGGLRYWGRSPA